MITIYVDGDACPVKEEVVRIATRHALEVYMVSNQGLRASTLGPSIKGIIVGAEFDAADNWIEEHIGAGDIAITADIQLAARCLKKGALALNPNGQFFSAANIGSALAMRELNQYLREAGEIKGYNQAFSKKDRSQFLQSLHKAIEDLKRG